MLYLKAPFRWLCFSLIASLLSACAAAPPVQEMSDARQAVAAAREAGADQYAGSRIAEAEALLSSAEQYLGWDNSSGYWSARRAAISAKEIAFDALLISRKAREAAQATPDASSAPRKPGMDSVPAFR